MPSSTIASYFECFIIARWFFPPDDGSDIFLRNVGSYKRHTTSKYQKTVLFTLFCFTHSWRGVHILHTSQGLLYDWRGSIQNKSTVDSLRAAMLLQSSRARLDCRAGPLTTLSNNNLLNVVRRLDRAGVCSNYTRIFLHLLVACMELKIVIQGPWIALQNEHD
jgi:hypothetical protein